MIKKCNFIELNHEISILKDKNHSHQMEVNQFENLREQNESLLSRIKLKEQIIADLNGDVNKYTKQHEEKKTFPACSEMDEKEEFQQDLNIQTNVDNLKDLITKSQYRLASLDSKNPLFYSERILRSFVAGLAISKLTILQGISGTGKTSLPRSFAKAIGGKFTIYENKVTVQLIDHLLRYLQDRIRGIQKINVFQSTLENILSDYTEGENIQRWYKKIERTFNLCGEAYLSNSSSGAVVNSLKLLENLRRRLLKLISSQLYKDIPENDEIKLLINGKEIQFRPFPKDVVNIQNKGNPIHAINNFSQLKNRTTYIVYYGDIQARENLSLEIQKKDQLLFYYPDL
ncbi:MAG: hypothetical protein H7A23_18475 [Leptospiraceae bacterium]|nr:hypothetical protein [Leptospiraceae bacterium]MCP5496537.1 hypothetical protein [Leptospiraceae bacterium]